MLTEIQKKLNSVNNEIGKCPEGHLSVWNRNGSQTFTQTMNLDGKRKRKSLGKKPEIAVALARKEFLQREAEILRGNIEALQTAKNILQEDEVEQILWQIPETSAKLLLDANLGVVKEEKSWGDMDYKESDYRPEGRTKITSRGLKVRSVAEVVIAERYYHFGIDFRYEQELIIGEKVFAPDLTIKRKEDGKIFYHEHCGMPQNSRYWAHHKWKLEEYENAGIVPWDNLIVTYGDENANIDVRCIDSIIYNRLM